FLRRRRAPVDHSGYRSELSRTVYVVVVPHMGSSAIVFSVSTVCQDRQIQAGLSDAAWTQIASDLDHADPAGLLTTFPGSLVMQRSGGSIPPAGSKALVGPF